MIKEKNNVVIIGGGIVGSLLALILGQNGLKVTIIDRLSKDKLYSISSNLRSYALNRGTYHLLRVLQIWDIIEKNSQFISSILLQQGTTNSSIPPFDLSFSNNEGSNIPIFYMVEEIYLRQAIMDKINTCKNIRYLTSRNVVKQKIENYYVEITLDNDEIVHSNLVVGSDGFPSVSANRAKLKHITRSYNQFSIAGVFRHEISHDNEAYQIFLPSGPLAILPLPGYRSSFVWTMGTIEAKRLYSLRNELFLNELNMFLNCRRGKLELENQKKMFPISLSIAEQIVKDRFILIGDSCHKIHPIAGQGLNLGIRDVAALAEVLIFARRLGEDIGSKQVLDRYAKWRNIDILSISFFTDIVNKVFSNENFLIQFGRGLSFKFLDNSKLIKKFLLKEASGLSGDIPKLLKGENI